MMMRLSWKKLALICQKKNTIPALSCGLNSKSIPLINKAIGTDYLANVGGAVHSNPEGSTKGAKLMRDTIDQYTNIKWNLSPIEETLNLLI